MNAIRQTQQLNRRELENATPPSASWHADYRDTAWIYFGGIPLDLTEGDVVTIFSQFGNPTHLNMIRDRENGKSKGFGFLKYEDQRSCDLAVDNLTGADVLGRLLRVDHTRYKKKEGEDENTYRIDRLEAEAEAEANGKRASDTDESHDERRRRKKRRPMLTAEKELEDMLAIKANGEDDEDPMKEYLINEKREEVDRAREQESRKQGRHKHRHRHRDGDEDGEHLKRLHHGDEHKRSHPESRRQHSPRQRCRSSLDREDYDWRNGRDDDRHTKHGRSFNESRRRSRSRSRSKDREDYSRSKHHERDDAPRRQDDDDRRRLYDKDR